MTHPYQSLPADRFWRSGVADLDPMAIAGLWQPKFRIGPQSRIVTAGSCFAQHFSRALTARGYDWVNQEPGPEGLTPDQARDYHYGTFSFRTGNIYTPRMLRQWLTWALTDAAPPPDIWETDGRVYDPFRPGVEPGGFADAAELNASRRVTLAAIREAVAAGHVFVFTMGLTEAWQNRATGTEYAVCPGTIAGRFDAADHVFVNHRFAGLMADLTASIDLLQAANPALNLLLTVSPVPLTATASGQHVLTATSHSKSLLRAVASEAAEGRQQVDYFPSYEIITHPAWRGRFFAPNLRSVLPEGVDHVMSRFFLDQAAGFGKEAAPPPAAKAPTVVEKPDLADTDDLRCEEAILDAFAPGTRGAG